MYQNELRVGTVVRKYSGQAFGALRGKKTYTTIIERIVNGEEGPQKDEVWFSTRTFMYRFECLAELEALTVPTDDAEPEDSTSGQTEGPGDELTGGSVDYYKAWVKHPTSGGDPYELEVNDFAEAFGLNYAEATIVKAIARLAQLRRDSGKPGSTARYEAEKQFFFAERVLIQNT